jgi:hypothetical protein
MRARSITRSARSCIPQSQATAIVPGAPSVRGTSFHPVPLQSVQFSKAMLPTQTRYSEPSEKFLLMLFA